MAKSYTTRPRSRAASPRWSQVRSAHRADADLLHLLREAAVLGFDLLRFRLVREDHHAVGEPRGLARGQAEIAERLSLGEGLGPEGIGREQPVAAGVPVRREAEVAR